MGQKSIQELVSRQFLCLGWWLLAFERKEGGFACFLSLPPSFLATAAILTARAKSNARGGGLHLCWPMSRQTVFN